MNQTGRIAGLLAAAALVAQASIADQFTLRVPIDPYDSNCATTKKAPTRLVIVEKVTKAVHAEESRLPFVGESPFVGGGELPQPFVGERPKIEVTVLPYFGTRPDSQPRTDPTSMQIPAGQDKR